MRWLPFSMSRSTKKRHLSSVYDLISSPAYVVQSAVDEFHDKNTWANQL